MRSVNVKKPFGTSVRAWRNRLGLSQEELAERAGLHRTYVSDVERGARNLSLESIEKLARALEVSVPALLSYSRDPMSDRGALPEARLLDILLVEDLADDVALTVRALKKANVTNRIHVVQDGVAALDYLFCTGEYSRRRGEEGPPLILLDLGLPKIDGLEVLRRIKADPRTHHIPVIVLTASSRDRYLAASVRLGAETYIVKPVDFQSFYKVAPKLNLEWALLKPAPVFST